MTSKERCPKTYGGTGRWRCTKRRGHDGPHLSYVPVTATSMEPKTWLDAKQRRAEVTK